MAEFTSLNGYDVKDKKAIRFHSTVANMIADDGLKLGEKVLTSGYNSVNDGGNGEYVIVSGNLTADGGSIIALDSGLFAKLIIKGAINVKQFGCYGDGSHDDSSFIANAISYISNGNTLYFPEGTYLVTSAIKITKEITVTGPGTIKLGGAGFNAMTVTADNVIIDGLSFINPNDYTPGTISSGNIGDAIRITANKCNVKNCKISNYIAGVVVGSVDSNSYYGNIVENNNISIKGLNTGYINDGICSLTKDTIIKNNYITVSDTTTSRGAIVCDINAINNIVEGNICDCGGYCGVGVHSESSSYTIIKNNLIFEPRLLGTTISTGTIVANNYIETPHNEVTGYSLDHCAISLYGSPKNCIVDGNLINCFLNSKYAIRGNGNIAGTKIINNSIYSTTSATPTTAIYLHQAESTLIGYNAIRCTCSTGITVNAKDNVIIGNIITNVTNNGIKVNEAFNTLVTSNRIIASITAIDMYNATNSVASDNIIGNDDAQTTTGIYAHCTSTSKLMTCVNNIFINTATEYDRSTYGAKTMVRDNNELDVLDTTLETRKKITVDNGSVVVS